MLLVHTDVMKPPTCGKGLGPKEYFIVVEQHDALAL